MDHNALGNQNDTRSTCDTLHKTGLHNVEGFIVPRLRFHVKAPECPKSGRSSDLRPLGALKGGRV